MAALQRFGGDAVGLGAAGIVIGTSLAALHAPIYLVTLIAAAPLVAHMRWRMLLTLTLIGACALAGVRNVGERTTVFDPFESTRDVLLIPLVTHVSGDAGALAAGLTLGDAEYFSGEFRAAMKLSSTSHLVALSGFNVALMLGFSQRLLRGRVTRKTELYAGVALLLSFVLIAGFQPSLMRAALMGSVVLIGSYIGRRVATGRLLVIAAATLLLIDPRLITHRGFILSFISSWALLATVGDMEALLARGRKLKTMAGFVVPTLVAQLGVAPALLAATGSVMLIGLLINPILIPVTPLLTALSGVELILAHSAAGLASVVAPLVGVATYPVTAGISIAARIPLTLNLGLPVWSAVIIYAAWIIHTFKRKPELW